MPPPTTEQHVVRAPRHLARQQVMTEDGVALCTDVFLPEPSTVCPTVVARTPYGRQAPFLQSFAVQLTRQGFAVVVQDRRGRYDLHCETSDGRSTLTWLAAQPWCDGQVAVVGASIGGFPSFRLCLDDPPSGIVIRAMLNLMGVFDHHALFYRDGALLLHWALPWCTMMGGEHMGRTTWQRLEWARLFRT